MLALLLFYCDLQGRKINFTTSKNFGWLVDVATATRVTFDLPECKKKASKGTSRDGSKKMFFLEEMLQEIVQQLRSKTDFEHPSKKKKEKIKIKK